MPRSRELAITVPAERTIDREQVAARFCAHLAKLYRSLAADDPAGKLNERQVLARSFPVRWRVGQLQPASLVDASDRLHRFSAERYAPMTLVREVPVTARIWNQTAEGSIDLLVKTPRGPDRP